MEKERKKKEEEKKEIQKEKVDDLTMQRTQQKTIFLMICCLKKKKKKMKMKPLKRVKGLQKLENRYDQRYASLEDLCFELLESSCEFDDVSPSSLQALRSSSVLSSLPLALMPSQSRSQNSLWAPLRDHEQRPQTDSHRRLHCVE